MFGAYSGSPWIICDSGTNAYWSAQSLQAGTVIANDVDHPAFSRAQLVWDRTTPVGTKEDVVVTTMDFCAAAATNAAILSAGDKTDIDTGIAAWWTTCKAKTPVGFTLRETRWYDYDVINTKPGPVVKTTASGVAATGAARLPDQNALTVTRVTASRKHWGRSYLPTTISGGLDGTYGRWTSAHVDAVAAATRTLMQITGTSGIICPVVASIQYNAVLGVRMLQVDDVSDVIRSRRAKNAVYRRQYTS